MGWREKNRPEGVGGYWFGTVLRNLSFSGHKRNYSGGFYRHPKTTQERRLYDEEYGRSRRSTSRLIDAWDDTPRSDWRERSWKKHRRHQWKPKGLI